MKFKVSMSYAPFGWNDQTFSEYGYLIYISPAEAKFGADTIRKLLTVGAATYGAAIGALGGTVVVPGVGTVTGSAAGGIIGGALGGIGGIVIDIAEHLVTQKDGSITLMVSPHNIQIGDMNGFDPNVLLLGLASWAAAKTALDALNQKLPKASRKAFETVETTGQQVAQQGQSRVDTIIKEAVPQDFSVDPGDAPAPMAAKSVRKTAKSGAADGKTLKTALAVERGVPVEGSMPVGQARFFRIPAKEAESLSITVYSWLLSQTYDVGGLISILDEEGGRLDYTTLLTSGSADDMSREVFEFTPTESGPCYIRISADECVSDNAGIGFRLKIK